MQKGTLFLFLILGVLASGVSAGVITNFLFGWLGKLKQGKDADYDGLRHSADVFKSTGVQLVSDAPKNLRCKCWTSIDFLADQISNMTNRLRTDFEKVSKPVISHDLLHWFHNVNNSAVHLATAVWQSAEANKALHSVADLAANCKSTLMQYDGEAAPSSFQKSMKGLVESFKKNVDELNQGVRKYWECKSSSSGSSSGHSSGSSSGHSSGSSSGSGSGSSSGSIGGSYGGSIGGSSSGSGSGSSSGSSHVSGASSSEESSSSSEELSVSSGVHKAIGVVQDLFNRKVALEMEAASKVKDALKEGASSVHEVFEKAKSAIHEKQEKVEELAGAVKDSLEAKASSTVAQVKASIQEVLKAKKDCSEELSYKIQEALEKKFESTAELVQNIRSIVSNGVDNVKALAETVLVTGVAEKIKEVLKLKKDLSLELAHEIKGVVKEGVQNTQELVENVKSTLHEKKEKIEELAHDVKATLKQKVQNTQELADNLIRTLTEHESCSMELSVEIRVTVNQAVEDDCTPQELKERVNSCIAQKETNVQELTKEVESACDNY